LDWADANQVTHYQINSVLDGKLCEACSEMNGKIFAVADAQRFRKKFLSVLGDKEQMKQEVPFLTKAASKNVRGYILVSKNADDKFYFCPFHPGCRCTCVAVYGDVIEESDEDMMYSETPEDIKNVSLAGAEEVLPANAGKFSTAQEAVAFYQKRYKKITLVVDSMPDDMKLRLFNYLEALRERYPRTLKNLTRIEFCSTLGPNTYGAMVTKKGILYINQNVSSSLRVVDHLMANDMANGWHPFVHAPGFDALLAHETGHLWYRTLIDTFKNVNFSQVDHAETKLGAVLTKFVKALYKKTAGADFSGYAASKDELEMIAEYFVVKIHNGQATKTVRALDEFFNFLNGLPTFSGREVYSAGPRYRLSSEQRTAMESYFSNMAKLIKDKHNEIIKKL
jgi:hypothetical protein